MRDAQGLAPFGLPMVEAWYDFPLGYHGKNGGLDVSGADVVRPIGLYPKAKGQKATLQPCEKLDFEMELAFFISAPISKGKTVTAKEAAEHVFGYVLLNDWSARDIQRHEMTPLGVFNSKSFSTTITPWIITLDALRSSPTSPPPSNDADVSSFLVCDGKDHGLFDIDFTAKVSRKHSVNDDHYPARLLTALKAVGQPAWKSAGAISSTPTGLRFRCSRTTRIQAAASEPGT